MNTDMIEDIYPLSPTQQGMLFHSLYAPHSGVYFQQTGFLIDGDLDLASFEHAWALALARHTVLRSAVIWEELDAPIQVVLRQVALRLAHHDWRTLAPTTQQAHLEEFLAADRARGFDLGSAPLMRLALIRLADRCYRLVWSRPHLLLDGWSVALLLQEVFTSYTALRQGRLPAQPPPRPYRDYIAWLQQQNLAAAETFWRRTLAGIVAPTALGVDRRAGPAASTVDDYTRHQRRLSGELTARLRGRAREQHLTLNTLMQGAWALLLHRYSGTHEVVFGTTVAGRPAALAGIEQMLGLFIGTLPVRVRIDPRQPLGPWLQALLASQAAARRYEYASLTQIQRWSDVPRSLPLFESNLVLDNFPAEDATRLIDGTLLITDAQAFERSSYPLSLVVVPEAETLALRIGYDRCRFDDATILRLLGHFQVLLTGIAADPTQPLAALPLLSRAERQQALVEWNATYAPFPHHASLYDLIAAQVARTPDAIALVADATQLSFVALHTRAARLAQTLRAYGVGPNRCVALCLPRSPDLLIALLAILAAGAAYLPLDPAYPSARLAFMLADAQPALLLTHSALAARLPATARPRLCCLDRPAAPPAAACPAPPARAARATDLLYLIYTSGSTGTPKGVLLDQRGRVNNFTDFARRFAIGPGDRLLALAALSFDMAAFDLLGTLAAGATIVLPSPDAAHDPAAWLALLQRLRISLWHSAPALLDLLLDHCAAVAAPPLRTLRLALLGGDWIPLAQPARLRASAPQVQLISLGGATELSMDSTVYPVGARDPAWTSIPYGRPLANQQAYVLDAQLRPLPIGVAGDLYLGGVGLAWGYHQRPDLTAARFVPNSFADEGCRTTDAGIAAAVGGGRAAGTRLYFTGDRARYGRDGLLELLGRSDQQIKRHGLRIEPGEIAAALLTHPAVQQAVVVAHTSAPSALVAYLVPATDGGALLAAAEPAALSGVLRAFLSERLPAYMVPSAFVLLDALPLTPNGKLDRAALPAPARADVAAGPVDAAPRTPTEQRLAQIWATVLGQSAIGIDDNFFDLGGDSFAAIRMVQQYGPGLALLALFSHPTIRALAAQLTAGATADAPLLVALRRPVSEPARTLVCVPYAGGSAVVYQPLAAALPADHALYAVELPGHDPARPDEPLVPLAALVPRGVAAIQATVRGPLVLYGHCGGVALTLALALALEDAGVALTAVCVAGALPSQRTRLGRFFPRVALWRPRDPEARLRAYIKALGGFNDVVDPVALGTVVRSFRHDGMEAGAYFQATAAGPPARLRAPILCIVGDQDPLTQGYAQRYSAWQRWSAVVRLAVVAGGKHYFVKHQAAQVAQLIATLPALLADD
jgi:amino acid adenylation domain-containing protein